jgi:hypothetical protein
MKAMGVKAMGLAGPRTEGWQNIKINWPNLFVTAFSAKRPKIKQFGRLISI